MIKGTKIRIYPTEEQQQLLAVQFGCKRWVWNNALAHRIAVYKETGKGISKNKLIKRLPKLKQEFPWLKEADSQVSQQVIIDLDRAFTNFFEKRARFPRFKKKYSPHQSIRYPQRVKFDWRHIFLPKVGWVRMTAHRHIESGFKSVTIKKTPTGKYFASVVEDDGIEAPPKPATIHIDVVAGIDLGLKDYLIAHNGHKEPNPKFLKRASNDLRKKSRSFSRKKKGSNNCSKARLALAKAHEKVANCRHDFQHKLSRHLIDKNQAIGVESLKVKNMLKNHRLAKAISDAAWGSFLCKLEYKSEWAGKYLVKIDTFFPSTKLCSVCGYKIEMIPLNVRYWTCLSCGTRHDRDINAATNVRDEAVRLLEADGCTVLTSWRLGLDFRQEAPAVEAGSSHL